MIRLPDPFKRVSIGAVNSQLLHKCTPIVVDCVVRFLLSFEGLPDSFSIYTPYECVEANVQGRLQSSDGVRHFASYVWNTSTKRLSMSQQDVFMENKNGFGIQFSNTM